jgi:hypothetical protein
VVSGRDGELPSYDELAAVVVGRTARLDELSGRIGVLEADNARLVAENEALRAENGWVTDAGYVISGDVGADASV